MDKTIVVIPTYNEGENVERLIKEIFSTVSDIRVQIVDDNSPDGTADKVTSLKKIYPKLELFLRPSKEGLGVAYTAAFKKIIAERGDIESVVMMDADMTHDPKDLPKLLLALKDSDFVIGSSLMKGGRVDYPWYRNLLSRWSNFYCSAILGVRVSDWMNAYVAMKKSALEKIDLDMIGAKEFAFIFALKYALLKKGLKMREVSSPAMARMRGESKMRISTIVEAALFPWKIRNRF